MMLYLLKPLVLFYLINYALSLGIPEVTQLEALTPEPLIGLTGRDTLTIKCAASGNPTPTLSWYFNGTLINGRGGVYNLKKNNAYLIASMVEKKQEGYYKCLATNKYGSVFDKIFVKLHYMGEFKANSKANDPVKTIDVTVGRPAELSCPPHDEGSGNIYVWGFLPANAAPTIWHSGEPPIENAFVTSHGKLIYSAIQEADVKRINKAKGVSCILYREKETVQSVKIKLKIVNTVTENKAPKFEAYMEKQMVGVVGSPKDILCGATGFPQPAITWFKDGVEISSTDEQATAKRNFTIQGNGMKLNIQPMVLKAEGTYKCVAKNDFGETSKSGYLTVYSAPKFVKRMNKVNKVTYEKKLTLKCEGTGIPAVKYEWYHNNTVLVSSDRYTINGQTLTIESADFSHSGLYMCVISNYLRIKVQPVFVIVGAIPPTLTKGMEKPSYIFKDYNQTLSCAFKAAPAAKIYWSKDDVNITDASLIEEFSGGSKLNIRNVKEKDSGSYKCSANNVKGNAGDQADAIAVVKTVITKPPIMVTRKEGSSAELFCDAVYEKEKLDVTFEWLSEDNEVSYGDDIYREKRINPPSRILYFKDLKMAAAGEYTCHVSTKDPKTNKVVSEDKRSGGVIVIGTPMKPSFLKFSGNCSDGNHKISLSWEQKNYYKHEIAYYIVEFASKESNKDNWIRYDPDNKITNVTVMMEIKKLPSNANLKFRVRAVVVFESEEFISDGTVIEPENCMTPPGAPIVSPTSVTAETTGPGTLVITWEDLDPILKPEPNYGVVVTYRKLPNGTIVTVTVNDTNKLVVPNPGNDEQYEVVVQSKNDDGLGPKSPPVVVRSGGEIITTKPENVEVNVGKINVTITWDPVPLATTYKVYYERSVKNEKRKRRNNNEKVVEVDTTSKVLSDLPSGEPFKVSVSAANSNGEGPKSDYKTFQTRPSVPGAPGSVDLHVYGDAIRVTWQPPPGEKSEIEGYVLTWYKTDEIPPIKKEMSVGPDVREAFITENLENLSYYTVELQAINDMGLGKKWKMEGVVVSVRDAPGKPGKPIYSNFNGSTMDVKFTLPTSGYYGSLPDNFTIFYYPLDGDKADAKSVASVFPSDSNITLYGLVRASYKLYAVAINQLGAGEPSDETVTEPLFLPPVPARDTTPSKAFYQELWFLILIILIVLILLIALILCCCLSKRGGKYPVGQKEKDRGGWDNQPLKDYSEIPMDDINGTPIVKNGKEPVRSASQNSLKPPFNEDDDDDRDSLDDYGEDTKFNEDGSFIGQYGEGEEKAPPSDAKGGATMV